MKRFLLAVIMITSATEAKGQTPSNVVSVSGAAVDSALDELATKPAEVARELSTEAPNRYQVVVLRNALPRQQKFTIAGVTSFLFEARWRARAPNTR